MLNFPLVSYLAVILLMAHNGVCKHRNFNDLKTKTMEEKEMEFFTDIMRKCGVNTEKHTWSELEDMAKAMETYHQAKLKLLGLHNVSKTK